ncbi:MAG: TIR domain-containing protein [Clostridia bacterium]|nr:TIR domain-containing protein [Clostridia bacterium]
MENPKIFISYGHDTEEFGDKVLDFSNRLRREFGIDAEIDQYEESPAQGWPMWMDEQIGNSDYVLVICTKSYFDKVYRIAKGKGVTWEIQCIYQHLYATNADNRKFIPIIFDGDDVEYIPTPLKPYTYYNVSNEKELKKLVNRLHGIKNVERPSIGEYKPLPEKERRNLFFSSPIDLELWNQARWRGAAFLFSEDEAIPPVLGLPYQNFNAGKMIFSKWKEDYGENINAYLQITVVEPPFSILTRSTGAYDADGEGYFVLVQPNSSKALKRAEEEGMNPADTILMTIQRYLFIEAAANDWKRSEFKRRLAKCKKCWIIPCGLDLHGGIISDFDMAIEFENIRFIEGISIKPNELESVIYNEAQPIRFE